MATERFGLILARSWTHLIGMHSGDQDQHPKGCETSYDTSAHLDRDESVQ
jgi:hypothetical protein